MSAYNLALAIKDNISSLQYDNKPINVFFGRTKAIKYPCVLVYFSKFESDFQVQNMWENINATVVLEFSYAKETDDIILYEFGEKLKNCLKNGVIHNKLEKKSTLKVGDISQSIVDGFMQIVTDIEYQVDTQENVDYENMEKMKEIDINLIIEKDY